MTDSLKGTNTMTVIGRVLRRTAASRGIIPYQQLIQGNLNEFLKSGQN